MMLWLLLSIGSALFLGIYEVAKKLAVRGNSVTPVLFWGVFTGAILWMPFVLWSAWSPGTLPHPLLRVAMVSPEHHLHLMCKSLLVGGSWALTYAALKRLPITLASAIRGTGPVWTIVIATCLWGERPSVAQWAGIVTILISFYAYSCVGKLEGIQFHRDGWVGSMLLATLLSACSGLYDKFLLQTLKLDATTVQAWFSIDLVAIVLPSYLRWRLTRETTDRFHWRWSIVGIGLCLLVADFLYFMAIAQPGALISIISPLRRTSVVVTFASSYFVFGELNLSRKAVCMVVMLIGVILISLNRIA